MATVRIDCSLEFLFPDCYVNNQLKLTIGAIKVTVLLPFTLNGKKKSVVGAF